MKYFANSVAGLQAFAAETLAREKFAPRILRLEEGFILFEAKTQGALPALPYLNNVFGVLAELAGERKLDAALRQFAAKPDWAAMGRALKARKERGSRTLC